MLQAKHTLENQEHKHLMEEAADMDHQEVPLSKRKLLVPVWEETAEPLQQKLNNQKNKQAN